MLPLQDIKVLDVSQIMAGPYCTMVLADMGAEVIKVEKLNGGDDSRQMGPYVNGESTCFSQINRNKKSISLNLKDERARQIFYRLAADADVIVENYRPGSPSHCRSTTTPSKPSIQVSFTAPFRGMARPGPTATKAGSIWWRRG